MHRAWSKIQSFSSSFAGDQKSGLAPSNIIDILKALRCTNHERHIPLLHFAPSVSSIGTYNYSMAKNVSNFLQPDIPFTFIASDSFNFVKEINDLSLHGKFVVSFDVESLFTNIPLEECLNLAVKYISIGNGMICSDIWHKYLE